LSLWGLTAIIAGDIVGGPESEYRWMFIIGGVAAVAIGLCLCFAGWFVDHKNK
jgi:hypothetical protein